MTFTHRYATALLLALGAFGATADDVSGPQAVTGAAQPFKLGALALFALHDAQYIASNDGKTFGVDAGAPAVATLLQSNKLPVDHLTLSVNALLIRSGTRLVLIDAGLGATVHGALISSLAEAGVTTDEITDVLLTHTHGDHAGGLIDANHKLTFPNAVIRLSDAEWAYMKSQPGSDLAKVIEGHVQTFAPGSSPAPGITAVALAGHTPGHVGYEVTSGLQSLLDIGDMAHHFVVSLQRPEWTMQFDGDSDTAKATRKATLARLAASHELVFAPHFPYPGLGYVVSRGDTYAWVPHLP